MFVDAIHQRKHQLPDVPHQPGVSIVICTREHPEQLRRQLHSVTTLIYPDYEVIVIDNAPRTDGTRQVCREFAGRVRYIHPDCGFWMLKRSIADAKMRALSLGRDRFEGLTH